MENMGLLGEANHSFLLSVLVWLVQRDRSRSISIFSSNIPHFHASAGENTFVNCSEVTTPEYKSLSLSHFISVLK